MIKLSDGYFYYLSTTGWKRLTSYGGNTQYQFERLMKRVQEGKVKLPEDFLQKNLDRK